MVQKCAWNKGTCLGSVEFIVIYKPNVWLKSVEDNYEPINKRLRTYYCNSCFRDRINRGDLSGDEIYMPLKEWRKLKNQLPTSYEWD